MTTWEIDIELRVRKTLIFGGPATIVPLLKWEPDGHGYGRHPVETIIDNDPQIVAVREVAGDD